METIQYELGSGATIALPVHIAVKQLIEQLQRQNQKIQMDLRPKIGEPWPEQGGIYIGSRVIEGVLQHRIIPGGPTKHAKNVRFDDVDQAVKQLGAINGFDDWKPASMEDLFLCFVHARKYFPSSGQSSVYWTNKPYGAGGAWGLDFERGGCSVWGRNDGRSVLPVRSIIA